MAKRNKVTVDSFSASNFHTTESRPYLFTDPSTIWIHFTHRMTDGRKYMGVISICLLDWYMTDGASTKWPISILVPNWRHGDNRYNAAPTCSPVSASDSRARPRHTRPRPFQGRVRRHHPRDVEVLLTRPLRFLQAVTNTGGGDSYGTGTS